MKSALFCIALLTLTAVSGALDLPASIAKKLMGEQDSKSSSSNGISPESIDNSIDPETYMVGGGDAFQIAIVGLPSQEYLCTVNSDGNIYIADVGEIKLGKTSLTRAIQLIRDSFRNAMKNRYQVYVSLKKAKRPVVTVMGAVSGPGTYHMEGTQRLLDAVKLANDGKMPNFTEINLRRVECTQGDSTHTYDLLKYLAGKDKSQNPYVYPGDQIEIRSLDFSIYVGGPLSGPFQGRLPLVPGESAEDVLGMVSLKSSADAAYFLYRKDGEPSRKVPRGEAGSIKLADNDVISIPTLANFGSQDTVMVSGEVMRPGTYPIVWGKTTAAELLEFAGGPKPNASPERAFVIRSNKIIVPGASYIPSKISANQTQFKPTLGSSSQVVRPEISSSLNDLLSTNDYAVIRLSDFRNGAITLENGDEIHVPRKENLVYVSGSVKNPGGFPFTQGKDVSHYIGLAKGYSAKADKPNLMVMTHYKGITQLKDGDRIEEGDVIVVPASIENKRFSTVYLPLIQVILTAVSLTITAVVLINQAN
jgi:polysaccharide export outer membrane protein